MGGPAVGGSYSVYVGAVFVFNIMVGTGALTLPKLMGEAGLVLGSAFLALVTFFAYISATFVFETLALCNHIVSTRNSLDQVPLGENDDEYEGDIDENQALVTQETTQAFAIKSMIEIGAMSNLILPPFLRAAWFVTITVYLLGDLAIYAVTVPKTVQHLTGELFGLSSSGTFHLLLAVFALVTVPWTFYNVQKTKLMQLMTTMFRHLVFLSMIVLALLHIAARRGQTDTTAAVAPARPLNLASFSKLPALFGGAVYAFMFQQYIPQLLTPIRDKSLVKPMMAVVLAVVFAYYLLLSWTANVAFAGETGSCGVGEYEPCVPQDLYIYNFAYVKPTWLSSAIIVLPLFGLTFNYPLIAITLRDNLQILYGMTREKQEAEADSAGNGGRMFFALAASLPPIVIAAYTQNIDKLVSVTGAFGGCTIQFVFPALLVWFGRLAVDKGCPEQAVLTDYGINSAGASAPSPTKIRFQNPSRSPFEGSIWPVLMLSWALLVYSLTTVYLLSH